MLQHAAAKQQLILAVHSDGLLGLQLRNVFYSHDNNWLPLTAQPIYLITYLTYIFL